MALDTKEKRANIPGVGRPWMRDKFPVATPDEQWRMASGLSYGGNALSAAVGPMIGPFVVVASRVFSPGAVAAQARIPGVTKAGVYLPGPVAAEVEPE